MSFSSEVKEELNNLSNLANKEAVKYEFLGYLMTNHMTIEKNKMKFSTENEYNINRFSKLLNNLQQTKYEIQIVGKTFSITASIPKLKEIPEKFKHIHFHAYSINYGEKGEIKHLKFGDNMPDGKIGKPNLEDFVLALKELNINPWVISEALDSQEIGAKYMRDLYAVDQ